MNELLFLKMEFLTKLWMKIKTKKVENIKKNEFTKFRFKERKGQVKNINRISFPSLPPIIFKLNNRNEKRKTIKKKKFY